MDKELAFQNFLKMVSTAKEHFIENSSQENINYLIYGPPKAGKTSLLRTARKPVYVYEFDKGGANTHMLRDAISKGEVIIDTRFDSDNAEKPTAWQAWTKDLKDKALKGFFNFTGTVVVDSATSLSRIAMNYVLMKAGRPASWPYQQDYPQQMALMWNAIALILSQPCDVIILAHDETIRDEMTGRVFTEPMLTGKHRRQLPIMFDEIYVMYPENLEKASIPTNYVLLTKPTTKYIIAGSRIGGNVFEQKEKPDLEYLRSKAGLPMQHREIPGGADEK